MEGWRQGLVSVCVAVSEEVSDSGSFCHRQDFERAFKVCVTFGHVLSSEDLPYPPQRWCQDSQPEHQLPPGSATLEIQGKSALICSTSRHFFRSQSVYAFENILHTHTQPFLTGECFLPPWLLCQRYKHGIGWSGSNKDGWMYKRVSRHTGTGPVVF